MSNLKVTNLQHASAASPAIVLAADGTATAALSSLNGGPLSGARNRIINGDMRIAQRGTSFTGIGSAGAYSIDRWLIDNNTDGAVTVSQQTDIPSGSGFQYSLRSAVTTADSSIASGQNNRISQRIEGFNVSDLVGRTFTLSFWVRSTKTGTHCVGLRGTDRSYVAEYTVSASNTWEYKSITVAGGLPASGTWDFTNGTGLITEWTLCSGSTFQTTAGSWQAGAFFATSAQVNCLDSTSNIFAITGVQLEAGTVATPFERRSYGQELALAQRYHLRFDTLIQNGNAGDTGTLNAANYSSTEAFGTLHFAPMRTGPSLSYGAVSDFTYLTNGTTYTPITFNRNGSVINRFEFYLQTGSSWTAGHAGWLRIKAGKYIALDAEL